MAMEHTGRISRERIVMDRQSRFNPIRGLTPEVLSRVLEEEKAGYLRQWSRLMDAIERRDDVVACVAPKRKKAVARRNVEVLLKPGVEKEQKAQAELHQEALKYFYENLEASNAVDLNECGGVELLVRQMMDAVGKKYAVHEVLWRPTPEGLTARLQFVPLHFFENRTGKLRFLPSEFATEGEDLEEAAWMVTVGDGIMEACSVAYMFKRLPLQDWLHYCAKHGMPGVHGKVDGKPGDERWDQMVAAVAAIAANFSTVTGLNEVIEKIDLATEGTLPYPIFVERMDRAISALWRGADLSTMSAGTGEGSGASLQEDETDLLEADDAGLIGGTLNRTLDRWVIEYAFGPGTKPLAYVSLASSSADKDAVRFQRNVWEKFLGDGTVADVLANLTDLKALTGATGLPVNEEYVDPYLPVLTDRGLVTGKLLKDSEGDVIGADIEESAPQPGTVTAKPTAEGEDVANEELAKSGNQEPRKSNAAEELIQNSLAKAMGVRPRWLAPVKPLLRDLIIALQDPSKSDAAVLEFIERSAKRMPELCGDLNWHVLADALEAGMGTAAVHGLKDAMRHSMNVGATK